MIKQAATGLNSRSEANPYDENGFLPLITAPMYSVVNETNYQVFLDNKIQVCLPRNVSLPGTSLINNPNTPVWFSLSLSDFISYWCNPESPTATFQSKNYICIDTANGNIPALHEAIRKAKEIHGDNLVIMAGNVASVEAFVELAKTGVDYIRVGIGGGGGCNTTSNTGVGQKDLKRLIVRCDSVRGENIEFKQRCKDFTEGKIKGLFGGWSKKEEQELFNIANVKIVADGISTYIKQCETKYGFNDNGYAAINKLLFAGADLVMIGKLFAQCLESAGEKKIQDGEKILNVQEVNEWYSLGDLEIKDFVEPNNRELHAVVKYSGMSTQREQMSYKLMEDNLVFDYKTISIGEWYNDKKQNIKPSEGSVSWIPIRWTLSEWLHGSDNQDSYPYLMGWINSIKSAMAYSGKLNLRK